MYLYHIILNRHVLIKILVFFTTFLVVFASCHRSSSEGYKHVIII